MRTQNITWICYFKTNSIINLCKVVRWICDDKKNRFIILNQFNHKFVQNFEKNLGQHWKGVNFLCAIVRRCWDDTKKSGKHSTWTKILVEIKMQIGKKLGSLRVTTPDNGAVEESLMRISSCPKIWWQKFIITYIIILEHLIDQYRNIIKNMTSEKWSDHC